MSVTRKISVIAALSLGVSSLAAHAGDVRVMWYSDGVEGEVIADLLNRFMQDNPDINVILDEVPYKVIQEQLPVQLESGQGPDIARVADIKALAHHWMDLTPYLSDPDYWRENFGAQANWMREDDSDAITGFMTQLTMVGGYANKTLFDQAGVDLPGKDATWQDWVDASAEVMESQGTPAALAIDRSGHRISGAIASYGGNFIGEDNMPAPIDEGTKAFITDLVRWTEEGKHLKDVWVSSAGTSLVPAADEFINAELPFYYSGSWQVANLSTKIGDFFDWVATGSPCGDVGCSGLAGGAALVPIKYTENPEDVTKVMEYLARADVVKEFSERTLFLPGHKGVAEAGGLNWQTDDPAVGAALDVFVGEPANLLPAASALPAWTWATAYYGALASRTSQVMAGELTLEQAFERMDSDIAEKVAQ